MDSATTWTTTTTGGHPSDCPAAPAAGPPRKSTFCYGLSFYAAIYIVLAVILERYAATEVVAPPPPPGAASTVTASNQSIGSIFDQVIRPFQFHPHSSESPACSTGARQNTPPSFSPVRLRLAGDRLGRAGHELGDHDGLGAAGCLRPEPELGDHDSGAQHALAGDHFAGHRLLRLCCSPARQPQVPHPTHRTCILLFGPIIPNG